MQSIAWFLFAFLCGSLPFSFWIGRLFLHTDVRQFGDANPGATNVLRAGGRATAVLALLLDFVKGAVPVWLAYRWAGLDGAALAFVALAPVLGHAFSPFLGFQGGKAVAVTGGIWCGLTIWEGPTVGGLLLGLAKIFLAVDGWVVLVAVAGMMLYCLLAPPAWNGLGLRANPAVLFTVGIGNLLILAWKHRADLARPFAFRPWLTQRRPR